MSERLSSRWPVCGVGARTWRGGAAFAMLLLTFLPAIGAIEGCGGGTSGTAAAQGNFVTTPSGTSTILLTPTGSSLTGKPLQFSPISLTLVVN